MELFITCSSGLEQILEDELRELGYQELRKGFRGIYLDSANLDDIYRINYGSRIAIRVLMPLITFKCRGREDLYEAVTRMDWRPYFTKAATFAVDANVEHPEIRNSLFAAQVVKDGVCDQLVKTTNKRPSIDVKEPDLQLNLFLRSGKGVLSFDTSLQPLHKRGYRQEGGEAPLRETLAAALLKMANYNANEIFLDPMAGSGTFLIEAAMMAAQIAPGTFRKDWGFFHLPHFREENWLKVKLQFDQKQISLKPNHLYACELNKNSARMISANCRAAGIHSMVKVYQGDFRDWKPPVPPTFLIANPPYGKRLDEESSLIPLYRSLGDFMKHELAKPSKGYVLTGSLILSKEIGLATAKRTVVDNGGVESRFLSFDIY